MVLVKGGARQAAVGEDLEALVKENEVVGGE